MESDSELRQMVTRIKAVADILASVAPDEILVQSSRKIQKTRVKEKSVGNTVYQDGHQQTPTSTILRGGK